MYDRGGTEKLTGTVSLLHGAISTVYTTGDEILINRLWLEFTIPQSRQGIR